MFIDHITTIYILFMLNTIIERLFKEDRSTLYANTTVWFIRDLNIDFGIYGGRGWGGWRGGSGTSPMEILRDDCAGIQR